MRQRNIIMGPVVHETKDHCGVSIQEQSQPGCRRLLQSNKYMHVKIILLKRYRICFCASVI
jgi:hypothetical protein